MTWELAYKDIHVLQILSTARFTITLVTGVALIKTAHVLTYDSFARKH